MPQNLTITLIQTDIFWENPTANMAMLEEKIMRMEEQTDLIILPEMFNSGFTMNVQKVAEPMNLTTFKWLKQMSAQTGAVITGSFAVKVGEKVFNRLIVMQPDGTFDFYDKRHLFRMGFEMEHYSGGERKIIVEIKGWKILPLVCYDLRFPVWSRNVNLEYDLLLYVASWPQQRAYVWNTLLQARAMENLSYVAGVNRVGIDGNDIEYFGESAIIDFKGKCLFQEKNKEIVHTQTLSWQALEDFRQVFPAHLDADNFEIL
jgi:omega-amidase